LGVSSETATIVGVVAAYKRPGHLRNLFRSLKDAGPLRKLIVVDNGMDAQIEAVCREAPIAVDYHRPERNLGCGGGVGRGLALGLEEKDATHFCLFDDDAEATAGALSALLEGLESAKAELAVPLIVTSEGHICWFPGLTESGPWQTIRQPHLTPEAYRAACGLGTVPFKWAPWPVLLLRASVVRECGFPRDDFWLCAEDVEYTLRLTYGHKGVLVPGAVCRHLVPPSSTGDELEGPHYLRFCLMLQNLSYICTRLPHARKAFRHLPGNYARFLRTFGWNRSSLRDVTMAFWRGGIRGKAAGMIGADELKHRFLRLNKGRVSSDE
jgi:GT2 family glycosyltransferase